MPRVSVILTCFNHLEYLPRAVQSVREQTYTEVEVIAIDDGSTDGTRLWLSEKCFDWTLIFNESNMGTYGSLNRAIERSSGEFIAILNDDDFWGVEKLSSQVERFDQNPKIALCHTGGRFVDERGEALSGAPLGFEYPKTSSGWILPELIYHNKIIPSSSMMRRSVLDRVGLFDPSFFGCGDWHLFLRIAVGNEVAHVDDDLLAYRVHGSNASLNLEKMDEDDARIRTWIASHAESWLNEFPQNRQLFEALAHNFACLGTIRTMQGDARAGRAAFARSIKMLPFRFKSYLRWLATLLPRKTFTKMR